MIKVNDAVNISDPKHQDSSHSHCFTGTVISFNEHSVTVRDQDNDVYIVSWDEIEEYDY